MLDLCANQLQTIEVRAYLGLIVFIITFWSFPSFALKYSFNGYLGTEIHQYFKALTDPTRGSDVIYNIRPELEFKGARDRLYIHPSVRINSSTEESTEALFLNIKEAFWEYKKFPFRFRIGSNTFRWGVIDGYSPLDVVSSRSYFNPLDSQAIGAPSVELIYEKSWFNFQAIYIAKQPKTVMPSVDSRWLPRQVLLNPTTSEGTFLLPERFNYYYPDHVDLDKARDHNFGIKLGGRFDDIDISLAHFEGASPVPQLNLLITGAGTPISLDPLIVQLANDIGLIPVNYRQRVSGGSLVWAPGSFIVRFESAYTHTISDAPDTPTWFLQNALGIEKTFSIGHRSLAILLQGYYGTNDALAGNLISSNRQLFNEAAVVGARFGMSTQTSLIATLMQDLASQSTLFHAAFVSRYWSSVEINVALDMIDGTQASLLGNYRDNDRLIVQLGYSW